MAKRKLTADTAEQMRRERVEFTEEERAQTRREGRRRAIASTNGDVRRRAEVCLISIQIGVSRAFNLEKDPTLGYTFDAATQARARELYNELFNLFQGARSGRSSAER